MICTLDCSKISTVKAFHIYIQYALDFPEWYGRNLDALYDMLCEQVHPLTIELVENGTESEEMKDFFPKLRRVIKDASEENPSIKLVLV